MIQNYVQLALGVWILISPWLLGFSSIAIMTWSNLAVGMAIILMNAWEIFVEGKEENSKESPEIKQQ